MPRIPEASFDLNPSTRMETPRVVDANDGTQALSEGVNKMVGAMAVFQDQKERTEAIEHSNLVKKQYNQTKQVYGMALDNVRKNGSSNGFYSIPDPTDDNPDLTKRRMLQGNINDLFNNMKQTVENGKKSTESLFRADIANRLIEDSLEPDLFSTSVKQQEIIFGLKQKEMTDDFVNTLTDEANNLVLDVASGRDINLVKNKISQFDRALDNKINLSAPVVGEQGTKFMSSNRDKVYAQAARSILDKNANEDTFAFADAMAAKIRDPKQKNFIEKDLEIRKKAAAQRILSDTLSGADNAIAKIKQSPVINENTLNDALTQAEVVGKSFSDSKYTSITNEEKIARKSGLIAAAVAKDDFVNSIDKPYDMFDNDSPESIAAQDEIIDNLIDSVDKKQLVTMDDGFKATLREDLRSSIKQEISRGREHLPLVVRKRFPDKQGEDLYREVERAAEVKGFGEPRYTTPQEASGFQKEFKDTMDRLGPQQAHILFSQRVKSAGEYSRAVAVELTGGKDDMAYLIAAADVPDDLADNIISNHAAAKVKMDTTDFGKNMKEKITDLELGLSLDQSNSPLYKGYVQSIKEYAMANSDNESDFKKNLEEGKKIFTKHFASLKSTDGRSEVFIKNDPIATNIDFSTKESKGIVSFGMAQAHVAPSMTTDAKADVLMKARVISQEQRDALVRNPSTIDMMFRKTVKLKSDPKKANTYHLYYGEVGQEETLVKYKKDGVDGNTITYTAKDLYEMGLKAKQDASRFVNN